MNRLRRTALSFTQDLDVLLLVFLSVAITMGVVFALASFLPNLVAWVLGYVIYLAVVFVAYYLTEGEHGEVTGE